MSAFANTQGVNRHTSKLAFTVCKFFTKWFNHRIKCSHFVTPILNLRFYYKLIIVFFLAQPYSNAGDADPSTNSDNSTTSSSCDKQAIPYSDLIIRPTGDPQAKYTISFGKYVSEQQANATINSLDDLSVKSDLVETLIDQCISNYLVIHGEFNSSTRARQEMWRLLSFQDPHSPHKLSASVIFKPASDL